jgi:hypothetical protein
MELAARQPYDGHTLKTVSSVKNLDLCSGRAKGQSTIERDAPMRHSSDQGQTRGRWC